MSHIDDVREGGWWPLQHHDSAFSLSLRRCMGACRVGEIAGDNITPAAGTYGDIQGGMLWEVVAGERDDLHSWFLTGPSVVATEGAAGDGTVGGTVPADPVSWSPVLGDSTLTVDTRYDPKVVPAKPSWWDGVWPRGWTATLGVGTEEYAQDELYHPDFWGLVAVNKTGNTKAGTQVFDLDADGDPDRMARLQSLVSVLSFDSALTGLGLPIGKALALQLGPSRIDEKPGYALFVDHEYQEVGCGRVDQGGPFTTGRANASCPHTNLGDDEDTNNVQPLHLAAGDGNPAGTIWLFPGEGDGPMAFDGTAWAEITEPSGDADWREVKLRFDTEVSHTIGGNNYTGMWKWQVDIGGAGGGGALGFYTGFPNEGNGGILWGDFGRTFSNLSVGGVAQALTSGATLQQGRYAPETIGSCSSNSAGPPQTMISVEWYRGKPLPASFVDVGALGFRVRHMITWTQSIGVTVRFRVTMFDPTTNAYSASVYAERTLTSSGSAGDDTDFVDLTVPQATLTGFYAAGDPVSFKCELIIDSDSNVNDSIGLKLSAIEFDLGDPA